MYLCLMIVIKWLKYSGSSDPLTGANCAPNLLIGKFSSLLSTVI